MRKIQLRRAAVLSGMLALCHPVAIQASEHPAATASSLQSGVRALQFQVNDNFTLGAFQGGVISLKHQRSERSAVRVGLGLSLGFADVERVLSAMDTVRVSEQRDESNQYVRVDLQFIRYANPAAPVKLYLGWGPLVSFSNQDSERELNSGGAGNESKKWAVGASGLVRVELTYGKTTSASWNELSSPTRTDAWVKT